MDDRLPTSVIVQGLMRHADSQGGFAAVIARGDPQRGSILVILAEKGRKARIMERLLQPDGRYRWEDAIGLGGQNDEELEKFLARRQKYDSDLWILELDIASAERFAAEMNSSV